LELEGGDGGAQQTQSGGNSTYTTITMYGQSLLTANGGLGSTGIDGGDGATTSSTGVSCDGGGGMGSVNTFTYGTGGTRTFPGQDGTIYETSTSGEQSGNGGLHNLGQPPFLGLCFWNGRSWGWALGWIMVWIQVHQLPLELQMELRALEEEEEEEEEEEHLVEQQTN